jgi:ATP-binding cassette subfamily B protein
MKKRKNKPSQTQRMLARFLSGSLHHFALALVFVVLATLLEMITPKIITFTVDSVIGNEPAHIMRPIRALIERIGGVEALWVNTDGEIFKTAGFPID